MDSVEVLALDRYRHAIIPLGQPSHHHKWTFFHQNKTYELNFISLSGLWYVESARFISTLIPTPGYCFGSLMHEGGFRNWNIPGVYCMFYPLLELQTPFSSHLFFSLFLSQTQVFPKNFITKGSHMHWNTAGKQGSCSLILNFPCLCAILIVCHFCLQSRLCMLQIKTYGNMKGGAVPSLSSRDRLPGLAVATPGLCYVPHKSSSCFTNALPHLSAGLICQAELPGKFFCRVIDTLTNSTTAPPPLVLLPHFCSGIPCCPQLLLTVEAADAMASLYCATASVIVFTEVLTSTCPHKNVASILQPQAKLIHKTWLLTEKIESVQLSFHSLVTEGKLWLVVGNLEGIRPQKEGRGTEASGELVSVSIVLTVHCQHSRYSQDSVTLSSCNLSSVLHASS